MPFIVKDLWVFSKQEVQDYFTDTHGQPHSTDVDFALLMTLADKEQNLKREFANLSSWEEKYRKIIELGKSMPPLDQRFQVEQYRVKGCQSQVWLVAEKDEQGRMNFRADSDAIISRGLVAILVQVYSGSTAQEILNFKPTFINELGLAEHLSPSRANGLFSMLREIIILASNQ